MYFTKRKDTKKCLLNRLFDKYGKIHYTFAPRTYK